MRPSSYHGLLIVDKPGGVTSRAVVDRAQRWFPRGTRVGHTGTLDPLATGVLVLCVGTATRLAEYVQDMAKVYSAGVLLGARSDTDDADGTVTPVAVARPLERVEVEQVLPQFVGEIMQVPPAYSAAKVTGRRAYDLARRQEEVTLRGRPVRVYSIDMRGYDYPHLELEVRCGKGTYIRALARDLGERLGCGALIASLRRTHVGTFAAQGALNLESEPDVARAALLPLAAAVSELPRIVLPPTALGRLRRGQTLPLEELECPTPATAVAEAAIFDSAGALSVIAKIDPQTRVLRPDKVLPDSGLGLRSD
jgi:tRNA pseudouridine55 synthase